MLWTYYATGSLHSVFCECAEKTSSCLSVKYKTNKTHMRVEWYKEPTVYAYLFVI